MIEKSKSFLIRYTGEGIVRIFPFQVNNQLSEFVLFTKLIDGIRQCLPTDYSRKVSMSFAVSMKFYEWCSSIQEQLAILHRGLYL